MTSSTSTSAQPPQNDSWLLRSARHVCVHRPEGWEARAERLLMPAPAPVRATEDVRTG